MSVRTVAVVLQARMGSTRLPGKALERLAGRTLLGHCIARLREARAGRVVVATTTRAEDDELVVEARRWGAVVCRGSEHDVLERYVGAASMTGADLVVRATGDNPAVDPGSLVRLLGVVHATGADHAVERGLPYGSTVEIVSAAALRRAAAMATDPADREHVTTLIRRQDSGFRCAIAEAPESLRRPDLRFTVDTATDLAYMRQVIALAERRAGRPATLATMIAAADFLAGGCREVA
jgi:spore coat polysaccharide biosynthesis protein SpsF (cytidylyltransferase family)